MRTRSAAFALHVMSSDMPSWNVACHRISLAFPFSVVTDLRAAIQGPGSCLSRPWEGRSRQARMVTPCE
jgi:hypothetical protein